MASASRVRIAPALATLYIVWSSTYLALHFVVAELPALSSAGARFVLAGLVLLLTPRLKKGRGAPGTCPTHKRRASAQGALADAPGLGYG